MRRDSTSIYYFTNQVGTDFQKYFPLCIRYKKAGIFHKVLVEFQIVMTFLKGNFDVYIKSY